ncbi:uncharacterized protein [Rutidosis leptorrhynchoides]|uniref:uncharacterized protein n=1 Tax=Rutidosis leptorrhynchoides TaxID=125765 RepID=UPI003A9995C4
MVKKIEITNLCFLASTLKKKVRMMVFLKINKRRLLKKYQLKLEGGLTEETTCYEEAKDSPNWREAMQEEIDALEKNETWELVKKPKACKPVTCKWVYRLKKNSDGTINRFKARIWGRLDVFLAWKSINGYFISQRGYARSLLERFNMGESKPMATPMEPNLKMKKDQGKELKDVKLFRQMVGSLIYLTITRPKISYSVGIVSQFMQCPTNVHLDAAKRIIRYVKGSMGHGLWYKKCDDVLLNGFVDADWMGDANDRHSTSGYRFNMGSAVISWCSKKQDIKMIWEDGRPTAAAEDGGGGGGRRKPSWRERENNRRRERRRRAVAANIYNGLRAQGNYDLPKHCDNNEVLKALCKEAGWVVLPDGTTFRKGCKPPPPSIEFGSTSTNTTPCSSRKPSPSPPSSSYPSPLNHRFTFFHDSIPSSLPPLRISNSAPVTPPVSSPTSKAPQTNNLIWESLTNQAMSSFNLPNFMISSSAPTSPTRYPRVKPVTIPECDESGYSTIDSCQWITFQNHEHTITGPNSPTFQLVKPMDADSAILDKGKGVELGFGNGGLNAWVGEKIHDMGLDDLELTLGTGNADK